MDAATSASLYPKIDTSKHVVMQVNQPNYAALLAKSHEPNKAQLRVQQSQHAADLSAAAGVASPASTHANATLGVVPYPKDAQTLAEAMAASAGEGASKSAADYLSARNRLIANFGVRDEPAALVTSDETSAATQTASSEGAQKLLQTSQTQDMLGVYTKTLCALLWHKPTRHTKHPGSPCLSGLWVFGW